MLVNRGHISGVGRKIGVGKESDIYEVGQFSSPINGYKAASLDSCKHPAPLATSLSQCQ